MGMGGLFDNLKSFIAKDADRHLGKCTERYANFAAEQMETCVQSVVQIVSQAKGTHCVMQFNYMYRCGPQAHCTYLWASACCSTGISIRSACIAI